MPVKSVKLKIKFHKDAKGEALKKKVGQEIYKKAPKIKVGNDMVNK